MEYTGNLKLKKPAQEDFYNIEDQNENADKIDAAIEELENNKTDKAGETSDTYVNFTYVENLEKLVTGEKLSRAFGKIARAISDMMDHIKTVATSTIAGHVKLSNSSAITEAGQYALDAVEKNASVEGSLANQISEIDSRLNRKQTLSYINCAVRAVGGTSIKICDDNIAGGKIPHDVNYIPVIVGHEKTIDAEDHVYCDYENDVWYIRTNVTQIITIRFYELIYD